MGKYVITCIILAAITLVIYFFKFFTTLLGLVLLGIALLFWFCHAIITNGYTPEMSPIEVPKTVTEGKRSRGFGHKFFLFASLLCILIMILPWFF